jgi:hypothetical protein
MIPAARDSNRYVSHRLIPALPFDCPRIDGLPEGDRINFLVVQHLAAATDDGVKVDHLKKLGKEARKMK